MMQTPNYMDPFSVWKSLYTEMEPSMSQAMQKWLESDEYAALSGQMLSVSLQIEQNIRKNAEQMLQTYNIPTKHDFARMMELIIGLEAKVEAIEDRLIQMEQSTVKAQDIREQLTAVSAQLETISTNVLGTGSASRKRSSKSEEPATE